MTTTLPDPRVKSKPELTAERARELFDYDPDTGALKWKTENLKSRQGGKVRSTGNLEAGCKHNCGYVSIGVDMRKYLAHRVIWLLTYGKWPAGQIDHINGNRLDNRIVNLRDVAHKTNAQNRRKAIPTSQSKLIGVSRNSDRWKATIMADRTDYYLGTYDTKEEAHLAYVMAKRLLHEGCTI